MAKHLGIAKKFASQAEQLLESVEDPGQKATVCALLAIAHGVMEPPAAMTHCACTGTCCTACNVPRPPTTPTSSPRSLRSVSSCAAPERLP